MDRKICPGKVSILRNKFYSVYLGEDKKECLGLDIREQAVELAHRFPLLATSLTLNISEFFHE
jgi:hypothetical protein